MLCRRTPFLLLGAAALTIAVATLLKDSHTVYASLWFKLMWAAIALSGVPLICKRRMWRRPAVFLLHVSLLVILAGALVTSLTAKRGLLHLRTGIPTDTYYIEGTGEMAKLPCLVRLDSFEIACYPGTEAPRDYLSNITAEGSGMTISMNKIGRLHGFRLYQTSYDPDLQGTLLTVNHDPWGTGITYSGYLLFLMAFLFSLWRPAFKRATPLLLLLFSMHGNAQSLPAIPREKADSIERLQVIWHDRPCPIGTMARDFLQKVYGKPTYHGLSATQVVASWTIDPAAWNELPIIKQKGKGYLKMNDFVDYSAPTPCLKGMGQDPKTDEKVALILMLQQGTLVKPLPEDVKPLSQHHVSIELMYGKIPWCVVGLALSLLAALASLFKKRRLSLCAKAFLAALLSAHFLTLWYLCDYFPLSNTYETLLFIALCLSPFLPLGTMATLMVAMLIERNPQITPLMPVLNSPWLSAHVTCVTLSYTLLIISLFRRSMLRIAVSLLAVGIFLGAVWANVSWGSYWSWDPKEAWALVTLLIYSIPLHSESLPWFRSERNYRLYSVVALATLLMTYFGVNYLLGGMHSYA